MVINGLSEQIENIFPDLISHRRFLHQNPELSGKEILTSQFIYKKLQQAGIDCSVLESGCGVIATIAGGKAGKNVLYRADIDALPLSEESGLAFSSRADGVAHACGHDIHAAVLLGTAILLNKYRNELCGEVKFIFQGGEENFTGALEMIKAGVLERPKPDYILALHTWPDLPCGTIGLKKGFMMSSSSSVSFIIKGRGGHAAHPHKAIDPIIVSSYILTSLQTIESRNVAPLDSSVITFGRLTAGSAPNIIPDEAKAEGTVRSISADTDRFIEARIRSLVKYQAESFGAEATVSYERVCPPVVNDHNLIDMIADTAKDSIGSENIRWLETPSMGSEDFAHYLENIPGALVRLGTANDSSQSKLPLHSPRVIFDESSIKTGVAFMVGAITEILKPKLNQ